MLVVRVAAFDVERLEGTGADREGGSHQFLRLLHINERVLARDAVLGVVVNGASPDPAVAEEVGAAARIAIAPKV